MLRNTWREICMIVTYPRYATHAAIKRHSHLIIWRGRCYGAAGGEEDMKGEAEAQAKLMGPQMGVFPEYISSSMDLAEVDIAD